MKKNIFMTLVCLLTVSAAFAQTVKVTGQVTDAQTGEPCAFAFVLEQGTSNGVQADVDGLYTINVAKDVRA